MKRKILLINWRDIRNPEAGGAEVYYHEIFRRLPDAEWQVDVLAHAYRGGAAEETVDGVRVLRQGSRGLFNYRVPSFVRAHQNEYDLIIEDINKLPFFTPLYVSRPRLHMVMHFFGTAIFREAAFPAALYVYLFERLIPLAYRNERFVAISGSTAHEIRSLVGRVKRVDVIEPGVDPAFYRPSAPKSSTPLLVTVTRLKKYKNVQFLIDTLPALRERVPGTQLVVAGGGEYLDALRERAARRGVAQFVSFAGRVSEEEKRDLLSRATLFVNPSAKEGWGITTIEAAMCGTTSVASDVAGLCDSVQDGKTGVLFPYNDTTVFVERTSALLCDHERRRALEVNAREYAFSLTWGQMAERMAAVLEESL